MYRYMFLALLLAAPAFGQEQRPDLRAEAGCGPSDIRFEVKTDKSQHALTYPESGKALVYVIEDVRNSSAMSFGQVTTRIGLDGNWVAANHGLSYAWFVVEPGEHHVCTDWQSSLKRLQNLNGAADLTAQAGKIYYYRAEVTIPWSGDLNHRGDDQNGRLMLTAVDESEGRLLISNSASSTWKVKK